MMIERLVQDERAAEGQRPLAVHGSAISAALPIPLSRGVSDRGRMTFELSDRRIK